MKKIFLIVFCLLFTFTFSQTEKEMLDAGIKKSTVKKIFKKFDGDLTSAVERWANTGSGKLSKKFTESAEKLGLDKAYLQSKLKKARTVRMQMIAGGVTAAAAGIAEGMQKQHEIEAEHLEKQMEIVQKSDFMPSIEKAKRSVGSTVGSTSYGSNSINVAQPSYSGETTVYGTDQYGFDKEVGSMKDDGYGKTTIYDKDQYGFDKEVGSMKDDGYGKTTIYDKDQYGFDKEVGSMKDDGYGKTTIYSKDQYGFDKEVGSMKDNINGERTVYGKDQYGFDKEKRKYVKNLNGGYDIMEKDSYGFWKKVGSVTKIPDL